MNAWFLDSELSTCFVYKTLTFYNSNYKAHKATLFSLHVRISSIVNVRCRYSIFHYLFIIKLFIH